VRVGEVVHRRARVRPGPDDAADDAQTRRGAEQASGLGTEVADRLRGRRRDVHDRVGLGDAVVGEGAGRRAVPAQKRDRLRRRAGGGREFVLETELLGERGNGGAGHRAGVGAVGKPQTDVRAVAENFTSQDRVVEHDAPPGRTVAARVAACPMQRAEDGHRLC